MAAQGLGPQTKCALRRTSTGGVKRDVRVEQERYVVTLYVQIAPINISHVGEGIQVFYLRTIRCVNHRSVVAVGDPQNLIQRLTLGKLHDRIIELAADDEIDVLAGIQRGVRLHLHVGADKGHFQRRVGAPHLARQAQIALEARRRREQDDELVIAGDADRLLRRDLVGRRIEQPASLQQAGRICEPDRIPVRFDFPRSRPARACAAVKPFEGGRIQEKGSH